MVNSLKSYVYGTRFWNSIFKNRNELRHWRNRRDAIVKWFRGEQAYLFPFPETAIRVSDFDEQSNALLTFIKVENQHASYLKDLHLRSDSFRGLSVADIGSGPFPTLLVFQDCDRYCIDHLIDEYLELGYPLSLFQSDVHFLHGKSERIPVSDMFFDAVVSRNALDHVDDFQGTAREIKRVLKPGGVLHILVNYHLPTPTEPHTLNDSAILENFDGLNLRKLSESQDAWGFVGGKTVLWSNAPDSLLAGKHST
jgi:SAM-dependent methyltransferase